MKDNPELFYIDMSKISFSITSFNTICSCKFLFSRSQIETKKQEIFSKIKEIRTHYKPNIDREVFVYKYILTHVEYSYQFEQEDLYNVYGALVLGKAVCEGYSKAMKLLCDEFEIPCIIVSGFAINQSTGNRERHAWNIIKRPNGIYHVDSTWDCNTYSLVKSVIYYNVSDGFIARDHFWNKAPYPDCINKGVNERKIIQIKNQNDLKVNLKRISKEKRKLSIFDVTQNYNSTSEVLQEISLIIKQESIKIPLYSVVYVKSINCVILKVNF
ncbi:hypothetical protein GMA13_07410 [Ruminococcus sp. zg-924]|nr:hypothetical protein [Ruminococcus sp. zg-924]